MMDSHPETNLLAFEGWAATLDSGNRESTATGWLAQEHSSLALCLEVEQFSDGV